jgi:ribonuclease Z
VITGDAVYSEKLVNFAGDANVLVMCCYYAGEEIIDHDTEIIANYVLMSSRDAGKVAAKAFVHKMALVHIREKPQELLDAMIDEIKKDFDGEVVIGEDLLQILG